MSLAVIHTRARDGVDAPAVRVEVFLSSGLPNLAIVGLPETAVRESKDRVRAAIQTAGFTFPNQRVIINLAPADLPKQGGGRFDLPIALGILAATQQIGSQELEALEFVGELGLDGGLRGVDGVLPAALACRNAKRTLIVARANASEAALVPDLAVLAGDDLVGVCAHLCGDDPLDTTQAPPGDESAASVPDLSDVRGQQAARRALEVAAAGAHNLLFIGPPGTGKTMLAARLPGILPPMSVEEALETAAVTSVSGLGFDASRWRQRPFRAPHHTTSGVALVGGGSVPMPGEVSLAHHGVLFLDELAQFKRNVLDVLREPLESGRIIISRAARQAEYPASFQLIAAMNPVAGGQDQQACYDQTDLLRYRERISAPLLDRIDIQIEVPRMSTAQLRNAPVGEASAAVRMRVVAARQRQQQRAGKANARLGVSEVERDCALDQHAEQFLQRAAEGLGLTARACHRVLKVARTLADLEGSTAITTQHLSEAVNYRRLDRVRRPQLAAGSAHSALA